MDQAGAENMRRLKTQKGRPERTVSKELDLITQITRTMMVTYRNIQSKEQSPKMNKITIVGPSSVDYHLLLKSTMWENHRILGLERADLRVSDPGSIDAGQALMAEVGITVTSVWRNTRG
jgi:hypothetical protein